MTSALLCGNATLWPRPAVALYRYLHLDMNLQLCPWIGFCEQTLIISSLGHGHGHVSRGFHEMVALVGLSVTIGEMLAHSRAYI